MSHLPPLNPRPNPNEELLDFDDLPQRPSALTQLSNYNNNKNNNNDMDSQSGGDTSHYISNIMNQVAPPMLGFNASDQSQSDKYKKNFLFDYYKPRQFTDFEIEQCFESFDLSKTGFLCAAEIKRCFEHLNANASDQELDEMLRMCDTSGDGQVEFDEFQDMIYKECNITREKNTTYYDDSTAATADISEYDRSTSSIMQKKRRKKHAEGIHGNRLEVLRQKAQQLRELMDNLVGFEIGNIKSIFENFRLIDDPSIRPIGLIDYPDFCACLDVEPSKTVQTMFNFFKVQDNDQFPDHMDYRNFLISIVSLGSTNLEQKIKFTFQVFDIDGNGSIDRGELTSILSATQLLTGKALHDRVEQILRLADKDGNESLEFEEFAICARRYRNLLFMDF